MQKYFDLLLELLWSDDDDFLVEEKKKLSAASKKLEDRWEKWLKIAHKVWFIFQAYDDLLNEKISLDDFLATWDITSSQNLEMNNETSIVLLNSIISWNENFDDNTLFILDSVSFWSLADSDKRIIQNRAKEHNSEFVFC